MLVLSRRIDQELVFPNLDIRVRVLQVRGKVVKLGIDAPRGIPILRSEACDESELAAFRGNFEPGLDRHQLRNRLNSINLGVRLAQKQVEAELMDSADATLHRVLEELLRFDSDVGQARERVRRIADQRSLKLLVVEDDENERELLSGLLRMHGFVVESAANGLEAMTLLQSNDLPDFVLLDMKMPQMDGPEIISKIRSNSRLKQLRVFGVSGMSAADLGIIDGYDGWFPKPLDPERLIQAVTQGGAPTSSVA